ncbi:MAG: hypothetical protein OSB00_07835 [Sphingomonas bacterium]|mgnify:CR=1 FL=1|nr:hypothetical protein [Sphingomonas bacterium]
MRLAVELFYILLGLAVTVALTAAAAWSYPMGRQVIWWCGAGAAAATLLMGVGPLMRAWRIDRARS